MRKLKLYLYGLLIFIALILIQTKVSAVGTISLSSSKQSVTVGDEFSISVNLSGASVATLTARVSVDTSKVDYVSGPSNSSFSNGRAIYTWTDPTGGDNPKTGGTIVTFKFRAKQTGTAGFSVSGDFYSPDEKNIKPSFSGTSVTIKEKETKPPTSSGGGSTNTGGNTGTTGGGSSSGGSNQGGTSGGTTSNSKPSSGSGSTQNKPTGSTTNNNQNNLSTNANLKELHLDVEGLSPAFNKNTTNYNIVVDNSVSKINVNAIPEDSNAKVAVSGNTNLNDGTNKITILVTAQDNKTTKTYIVNATKTQNPDLVNAKLENLAIENVILTPEFNEDIFEYSATIGSTIHSLNILAVPKIQGASVNIQGADNLQFGENTITVSVVAQDKVSKIDYIVKLYKKTTEEEEEENKIMPRSIENEIVENEDGKVNTGNIVFCVVIVACIGVVIFILIKKYLNERNKS